MILFIVLLVPWRKISLPKKGDLLTHIYFMFQYQYQYQYHVTLGLIIFLMALVKWQTHRVDSNHKPVTSILRFPPLDLTQNSGSGSHQSLLNQAFQVIAAAGVRTTNRASTSKFAVNNFIVIKISLKFYFDGSSSMLAAAVIITITC